MKLYYEALSKIPKKFIDDDTRATIWDKEMVVMANPKYRPMIYTKKNGWKLLKVAGSQTPQGC